MADPVSAAVSAAIAIGKYVAGSFAAASAVAAGTAGATITAGQIATVVATTVGAQVAAQTLLRPRVSNGGSAFQLRLNPDEPVYIVTGRRGRAGEVAHVTEFGPDNRYLGYVITWSGGGRIDGFETFTASDAPVSFGANGAATSGGNFVNNMWLSERLGLQPDTALASPSGLDGGASISNWSTLHSLSGFACYMWTLRQDSKNATYPTGAPAPFRVGRGIWCYDWRKDSTFPGGDGPQRLDNPATWAWTRNGIVQAVAFQLGHYHGPALQAGVGVRPDALDWPAFTVAANVADENGWNADAVYHSQENKRQVYKGLLQAAGALPAKNRGKISCIARGYARTPVATLTTADTAGPVEIDAASSKLVRINSITPRFTDPAQKWEMVPGETVTVSQWVEEDRDIERHQESPYPYVTGAVQAGQLAALEAFDTREPLSGVWPVKPWGLKIRPGDAFTIEAPGLLIDGVTAVCLKTTYVPSEKMVRITWRSETEGKVAFALGQLPDPPPVPGLTPGDPYAVPAPLESEWQGEGSEVDGAGGTKKPVIIIGGNIDSFDVSRVFVDYRIVGTPTWIRWGDFPPNDINIQITGLLPNTTYEVRITYANGYGFVDESNFLILGPFTTGGEVASDALIPSQAIADAVDAINTALGSAYETLAQAQAALAALGLDSSLPSSSLLNWISDPLFALGVDGWRAKGGAGFEAASDPKGFHAVWTFPGAGADAAREIAWPERRPIREANWVQAAADVVVSGVVTEVHHFAVFEDEAGAEVGRVALSSGSSGRVGGVAEAPEGAAFVRIVTQPDASGAGEGAVTLARPLAAYALPGQSEPNAWTDPSNEIVAAIGQLKRALGNEAKDVRTLQVETRDARATIREQWLAIIEEGQVRVQQLAQLDGQLRAYVDDTEAGLQSQIDVRATITAVNELIVTEQQARATAIAQNTAQWTQAIEDAEGQLQNQITARATITYVDLSIADAESALNQAITALSSELETDYLSKADAQAIYYTEAQVNSAIAGFDFSGIAYFNGLEASVTSQGVAISDLETRTAAHFTEVTAGPAFAGIGIVALDSNGNPTSNIRMAAQMLAMGVDYNTPRRVFDMISGVDYALNAAGTVRTVEITWSSGRIRLRDPAGALLWDTNVGGQTPEAGAQQQAEGVQNTPVGIPTGQWQTVAQATINGMVNRGTIRGSANIGVTATSQASGRWRLFLGGAGIVVAEGLWETVGDGFDFIASAFGSGERVTPQSGNSTLFLQAQVTSGPSTANATGSVTFVRSG